MFQGELASCRGEKLKKKLKKPRESHPMDPLVVTRTRTGTWQLLIGNCTWQLHIGKLLNGNVVGHWRVTT